ncbi:MAG: hypothetical protein V9H26_00570, partial [Verrucomicrobiota bacterium]
SQTPSMVCNNLFVGGAVNLDNEGGSGTWAVYDNLFDTVNLSSYGTCPNGYNGYKSTSALAGGSNNKSLSTCDYVSGLLGDYYYSTTGGSGHLSDLIDAGSRTAVVAKLDDHTTRTDQAPDTVAVDVGFHYKILPIRSGFDEAFLPANDDESSDSYFTDPISLPFTINFFGTSYSSLHVNNNGSVTFDQALPIPFHPDQSCECRHRYYCSILGGMSIRRAYCSEVVRFGNGTVYGRTAFGVNWVDARLLPALKMTN